MIPIRFTVPGNPIPWERARSRGGQHFTAPRTRAHKQKIQLCAKAARVPRLAGPVKLAVTFFRQTAHACDLDNLTKSVQDALNGIAYADDRQIVALVAIKAVNRDNPRTEVEIGSVLDDPWPVSWEDAVEQDERRAADTAGKDPEAAP